MVMPAHVLNSATTVVARFGLRDTFPRRGEPSKRDISMCEDGVVALPA
jgi:hypothetical protein